MASSIVGLIDAIVALPDGVTATAASMSAYGPAMSGYFEAGLLRLDELGRLQVYISVSAHDDDALEELESLGVAVERVDDSGALIQARVPLPTIGRVAGLGYVSGITPPKYGQVDVGSRLTEGDALLEFDNLRSTLGVDGSGVTVGVLSDGIFGLTDAIGSGDLPATMLVRDSAGVLVSTTGGIVATSFRADGDL